MTTLNSKKNASVSIFSSDILRSKPSIIGHTQNASKSESTESLFLVQHSASSFMLQMVKNKDQNLLSVFKNVATMTGGYVQVEENFAHLPALIGSDSEPVFLYEFIEVIDEILDYEKIKESLPTLSFAQIDGAISFLRKLSQFNTAGMDIDDYIDEEFEGDDDFIEELKAAFSDQEVASVLNFD